MTSPGLRRLARLPAQLVAVLLAAASLPAQRPASPAPYVPARDTWERRRAEAVGMDSARLAEAIRFHLANETKAPRDLLLAHAQSAEGREPFDDPVGPYKERGDPSGVVLRHGYLVAQWGDPDRVDMTFSVTKSFLSSVVGVAFDRGMIRSLSDPVGASMPPVVPWEAGRKDRGMGVGTPEVIVPFETAHNRRITWEHMLRQTSDWEGTLWGKPDWADRPGADVGANRTRARNEPGTVYKYNDVRVNLLALAALDVWRRSLPEVLREFIMDPIGASNSWRWLGYDNSWVVLDGHAMQSVSGGGHWGGGMWINARDMARFGLLTLRRGRWGDRQLLSERWVAMALSPGPANPGYGFMNWFLNRDGKLLPSAPRSAFMHLGNGTNAIVVLPEQDVVVVVRWIENRELDGFVRRIVESVR